MLFRISVFLAMTLYVSCMEMRETVERTVMVRTSGSDLQPAATGYIYKKKNDGKESVIKMGESEVMEQLAKYYEQPKPVENKQSAEIKDAKGDERVIPVSEESDEKDDGLARDDFKKILEKYGVNFEDHDGYDDYSHSLGNFDDHYHGYGDSNKENKKGFGDYNNHYYGNGGNGDYHNEKYSTFSHSHKDNEENGNDNKNYNKDEDKVNEGEAKAGHNKAGVRFQKAYHNDQKDRKLYDNDDGVKFAFYKYGSKYYGDDTAHKEDESHGSGEGKEDKDNGANSSEQNYEHKPYYQSNSGQTYGKSFGFKINH